MGLTMQLSAGMRLRSTADSTQVVVVKAPGDDLDLRCGGHGMVLVTEAESSAPLDAGHSAGTAIGKRYSDDEDGIELLCTKAGEGSLSIGDEPLLPKAAKPLPSSD